MFHIGCRCQSKNFFYAYDIYMYILCEYIHFKTSIFKAIKLCNHYKLFNSTVKFIQLEFSPLNKELFCFVFFQVSFSVINYWNDDDLIVLNIVLFSNTFKQYWVNKNWTLLSFLTLKSPSSLSKFLAQNKQIPQLLLLVELYMFSSFP